MCSATVIKSKSSHSYCMCVGPLCFAPYCLSVQLLCNGCMVGHNSEIVTCHIGMVSHAITIKQISKYVWRVSFTYASSSHSMKDLIIIIYLFQGVASWLKLFCGMQPHARPTGAACPILSGLDCHDVLRVLNSGVMIQTTNVVEA